MLDGQEMTQPFSSAAETTVTCELEVHVVVGGEPHVSLPAAFHYHRADPYAVRLSIGTTSSGTVNWVFALSLLQDGMSRPVGEGDVLVSPRRSSHGPVIRIVVRSRLGSAVLDMKASPVAHFLDRARELVPAGTEGSYVDMDHIATLLLTADE
ncbi:SsgA family sporulation/cell division regulator [Streptomyces adustus]|nr:SsgA family sporulation/cell division regulator [Streptomyces adustus]